MRLKTFALAAALALPLTGAGAFPAAAADSARGAGATFPQPLYERWAKAYALQTGDAVGYAGTGSGDGVKQVLAGTVDFGGTDMPVANAAAQGLVQFPSVVGGVVVVANVPGIDPGGLVVDAHVLAGLFSGEIRFWDDAAVAALNTNAPLPHLPVVPVHRADSSGTTFVMTDYLSKAVGDWKSRTGSGTTVKWPTGPEAKGSDGMVAAVLSKPGAVGYVEYSYARKSAMGYLNLVNAEGRTVQPTPMSFAAATIGLDWAAFVAPGGDTSLTNRPGGAAWPLTTATFVLIKENDPRTVPGRRAAAGLFRWGLTRGGSIAEDLDYVPLPPEGVRAALGRLSGVQARQDRASAN